LTALAIVGFNPSVGILFIQASRRQQPQERQRCFNPSVGILFIQAEYPEGTEQTQHQFQSLGRDSVHSSSRQGQPIPSISPGFNPSVGILFIQAA